MELKGIVSQNPEVETMTVGQRGWVEKANGVLFVLAQHEFDA
jgi:hypothetical protein